MRIGSIVATPAPSPDVQMDLDEILEITPELAQRKNNILGRHHFVVVSISVDSKGLSKSSPYYEQNHAVDSVAKRWGLDIDVVRINLIFPAK
jgi:hypothetical protein